MAEHAGILFDLNQKFLGLRQKIRPAQEIAGEGLPVRAGQAAPRNEWFEMFSLLARHHRDFTGAQIFEFLSWHRPLRGEAETLPLIIDRRNGTLIVGN